VEILDRTPFEVTMSTRTFRKFRIFCGLVPLLFLASLAPSKGGIIALGSAGAGPQPPAGVNSIQEFDAALPVDRDGFFVFYVATSAVEAESAFEATSIVVRTASGEVVEGEKVLLDEELYNPGQPFESRELWIGWEADSVRDVGQVLEFEVTASNASGTLTSAGSLNVRDEEPELPTPDFRFTDWLHYWSDTGEEIICRTDPTMGKVSFGADISETINASIEDLDPRPGVVVAWKYRVEAVPSRGQLLSPLSWRWVTPSVVVPRRELQFADELPEYCVQVTATDLRYGTVKQTGVCDSPPDPLPESSRDRIGNCSITDLPEEYRARWCGLPQNRMQALCEPYVDPAPTGGTTGAGGSVAIGGADDGGVGGDSGGNTVSTGGGKDIWTGGRPSTTGGSATVPPGDGESNDEARATSKGCTCGVATAHPRESWLAFGGVALLALGLARRRSR
jgi:hypothetical protein